AAVELPNRLQRERDRLLPGGGLLAPDRSGDPAGRAGTGSGACGSLIHFSPQPSRRRRVILSVGVGKTLTEEYMKAALAVVFALATVNAYANDDAAPLGLPTSADLKTKCGLDDEQVKKVDALYAEYKDKVADVQK